MRAVNLIPAAQRGGGGSPVGESQGAAYAILGVLAGLAVLAFLYGSARHQISSRQREAATAMAQAQQAQAKAAALAPYVSFAALREQRTQAVSQLVDSRFDWSHAFHEFGRVLPAGVSLSSLDGTIAPAVGVAGAGPSAAAPSATAPSAAAPSAGGPASTGAGAGAGGAVSSATPAGSVPTFTISGCAVTQAAVALTITRLRLIDGVTDVKLQSSTKGAGGGGGGGASSGNCGPGAPVFTMQITFQPLPVAQAPTASGSTVASTGAPASQPSSGGAAR